MCYNRGYRAEVTGLLLDLLRQERAKRHLSHQAFAHILGVPRSTWYAADSGIRPLNNRTIQGAMKAFPHLMPQALIFLVSGATNGNKPATERTNDLVAAG